MEKDKKVTAEYVNNKMESMVSAMFDTMMETEERLKNLERKYYELSPKNFVSLHQPSVQNATFVNSARKKLRSSFIEQWLNLHLCAVQLLC